MKNLTVCYDSLVALNNINFSVYKGESVALLGHNGAGKTTALRAIIGILESYGGRIEQGEILFKGKSIKKIPTYELVKRGICFVPQGRRLFQSMTVRENLEMGGYIIKNPSVFKKNFEEVLKLFPILKKRLKQKAGTLSGGEQQVLAIARALMTRPKLLLLDEPLLGLSPNYIREVMEKVKSICKKGTSVIIVEHNAKTVAKYVNRVYFFAMGKSLLESKPEEIIHGKLAIYDKKTVTTLP